MADVNINKFRASVVRDGSKPASPGFIVSEGQDPVNPPGTNNYVPYSGATANVELGEYGVEAGFITLDTTPTNTPTDQGTIFWDADDETVDIVLNGYTMKIGEDLFYPVKNQTGSTIAKGVAVRFNGTVGNSGRLLIAPFIGDGSVPSSRFMGVTAEEILNGEDGKVLYFGRVRGINTNAFNEGDILYASTTSAGGYQTAIPVAPNNIVQVAAVVTKSATVGTIFVRPTLGSNINKDEGVKITSVADKNLLQYQSGTSLWENKSLAQVLGGTSAQFVKGDGSLDSTSYGTGTVTSVGLSSATSGVTIGSSPVTTSGTITLAIATASGSQNGLLSSTDWTTFNNKQNALTNPVTGTGTTNYLPKFTGSTTIGNSTLQEINGNLGLGVTPSAFSTYKAFQIGAFSSLVGQHNDTRTWLSNNAYFDGTNWKYIVTAAGVQYNLYDGEHRWLIAPYGTAGNAISFTQAMTLFSTGNLLVGSPSPISDNGARLQVSGAATISSTLTSTDLTIKNSANAETLDLFLSPSTLNGFIDYPSGRSLTIRNKGSLGNLTLASTGAATFSSSVTALNSILSGTGSAFADGLRINRNSNTNQYTVINHVGGATNIVSVDQSGNNIAEIYFGRSINGSTISNSMMIDKSGNVGIGTSSPSALLTVSSIGFDDTTLRVEQLRSGYASAINLVGANDAGANFNRISSQTNGGTTHWQIGGGGTTNTMAFLTGGAERMRITSGGNVELKIPSSTTQGILFKDTGGTSRGKLYYGDISGEMYFGTMTGYSTVFITNDTEKMRITAGGEVLIGNTDNGAYNLQCNGTGVWGAGAYVNGSDRNIKDNIATIEKGLEYIQKMNPVKFRYKPNYTRDHSMQTGFIAQELQEVFASEDYLNGLVQKGVHLSVAYQNLLPILVKAIQELKQEIDTLKN